MSAQTPRLCLRGVTDNASKGVSLAITWMLARLGAQPIKTVGHSKPLGAREHRRAPPGALSLAL